MPTVVVIVALEGGQHRSLIGTRRMATSEPVSLVDLKSRKPGARRLFQALAMPSSMCAFFSIPEGDMWVR